MSPLANAQCERTSTIFLGLSVNYWLPNFPYHDTKYSSPRQIFTAGNNMLVKASRSHRPLLSPTSPYFFRYHLSRLPFRDHTSRVSSSFVYLMLAKVKKDQLLQLQRSCEYGIERNLKGTYTAATATTSGAVAAAAGAGGTCARCHCSKFGEC